MTMSDARAQPPVLLLHGWGSTAQRTWASTKLRHDLDRAGREVILVDLPGHGPAGGPHEPNDYRDFTALAAERVPEGPLDGIGFSLGGKTLLWLEAMRPGWFRRIVVGGVGDNIFRGENGETFAAAVQQGPNDDQPAQLRQIVTEAVESGNDLAAISAVIRRPSTAPAPEAFASIRARTLVVNGAQDAVAGEAAQLQASVPSIETLELPDLGHVGLVDDARFQTAAARFILETS